jgi:carbon-monoxide dehydrogenase medium subunit
MLGPSVPGVPDPRREPVYPSRFEYLAPTSVEEVIAALGEREGAKVMAGGQSLIPVLKLRVASVDTVVDVNRVAGLDGIEEADGGLRIGALVRHVEAERSPLLTKRYGLLGATARLVADPLVRNRGTICGSLAHADPQGDWGSAMLAARGSVVVRGPNGERTIPVDELSLGPFMTTLQPDELITEVRVPDPGPRTGGAYLKLERKVGDFATAAVAVQVTMDNGSVGQVGIGLTGVGATNVRATAAEDALRGSEPTDEAIAGAARLAAEAAEPQSDNRGTADYKRNVVRVYCERGLRTAISAARAGEE